MWAMIFLVHSACSKCTKTNYFTECSQSYTHDLIVSGTKDCGQDYPKLYRGLDCSFECVAGTYLDIINNVQACVPCPSGTFNNGGGVIYGTDGDLWSDSLKKLVNECWIKANNLRYRNFNCTGWGVTDNVLVSGSSLANDTDYSAGLVLNANLVKSGVLTITYRKDTVRQNGMRVGSFSINKNSEQIWFDDLIEQAVWKTVKIQLEQGIHEINIQYTTKQNEENPRSRAYIASLQLNGTEYASKTCYKCPIGANKPGSTSCDKCNFNEYWNEGLCVKCPTDTYSFPGSSALENCKPRPECTENDYKQVYSECINDLQNITYVFKHPVICNTQNFVLPPSTIQVACGDCAEGYYKSLNEKGVLTCKSCDDGQFIDSQATSGLCRNCSAGTVSQKVLSHTNWVEIPENFNSYCLRPDGSFCLDSIGWIPSTLFLTSGQNLMTHSELFLEKDLYINLNTGFVVIDYEFLRHTSGSLDVYVDGSLHKSFYQNGKHVEQVELLKGPHQVQWVYWHNDTSDEEIRIYSIKVIGSNEGGATSCMKCPVGYFSLEGSDECSPCSAGSTSSSDNSGCIPCDTFHFSNEPGSECHKCPIGTINNKNRTMCLGSEYAYFDDKTYFLSNITGRGPTEGQYHYGVCSLPASKLYCHQSFYGPLVGNNQEFYVSLLNPSQLDLPSASYLYNPVSAYAYMVEPKKNFKDIKEASNQACNNPEVILSLGNTVHQIASEKNGFKIEYINGDLCNANGEKYSLVIHVECDKNAGIGWPSYEKQSGCVYEFNWKTKYGCQVCMYEMLTTVTSVCVGELRSFTKIEGENCILPFRNEMKWNEKCSEIEDYIYSWPMLISFGVLAILILIGFTSGICYYKYYRGYRRLVEVNP